MSSPRSWFLEGPVKQGLKIDIGEVILISRPEPSAWRILEVLHEHHYQNYESHGDPSYATIELCCEEIHGSRRAMIRLVMQIPHFGTETKDSDVRARQATSFRTEEMLALMTFAKHGSTFTPPFLGYCEERQDRLGPVPGGFLTSYAWEVVPGIRLGGRTGYAPNFWALDEKEREIIREDFRDIFLKITSIGIWPETATAANLVWDSDTRTLTWVDFRYCADITPQPWNDLWLARFKLVQVPNNSWAELDWDGDTSEWKFSH